MKTIVIAMAILSGIATRRQGPNVLAAAPPPPVACGTCWKPALNTSWQYQLSGLPVDQTVNASLYVIDLFDNDAAVVASLHAQGRAAVCYLSAGTWEDWRPDAGQFPNSVKGRNNGWPGEKWLDIRRLDILGPIMEARMDLCKLKGFDGVDPDNVDGFSNRTGFPLTYQDQVAYDVFIANAAHSRGLSVGLKNDVEQVADLAPYFDWTINEQCFQYNECDAGVNSLRTNFVDQNKAVFQVEYKLQKNKFCAQANAFNFNSMRKKLSLDAWRDPCR